MISVARECCVGGMFAGSLGNMCYGVLVELGREGNKGMRPRL